MPAKNDIVWGDYSMDEPLDEDGTPFFDPHDSEALTRVLTKYAKSHEHIAEDERDFLAY